MNSTTESTSAAEPGWRKIFACDLRSLAAMRIALGILILVDLAMRMATMQAMYSDAGFFPISDRTTYVQSFDNTTEPISWSIHAWDGSMTWQIALFAVAAIAATMMALGWKTRTACVVSWILVTSLQMRNPLILHSGDCLFRLALFWSMFLPLGAVWSLDAKTKKILPSNPVISGATVGLILTLFSLYFFAGISKLNSTWYSGEAMDYVLKLDIYATAFGKSLLAYPLLLKWITWGTLVAEIVLPILMFIPWKNERWRYLAMISFVLLHLSIAACMNIGLFSWVAIAVWLALLPSGFWNRLTSKMKSPDSAGLASNSGVSSNPVWSRLANGFCLLMAAYFLLWNVATIDHPALQKMMPMQARVVGKWLNLRQNFRMFDVPPKHSPWFVYHARLVNGTEIDIFRNKPVDHERPASVLATVPHHHWRRLHRNLARPAFANFRKPVSEYMIRRWNETHDEDSQIETARTTVHLDEITPGSEPQGHVTQVWHQYGTEIAQQDLFDDLLKKMKEKGIILP